MTTSITFLDAFPKFTLLRGDVVPEVGGTAWGDTVSAYEELPEPLKLMADHSWALHTNAFDYAAAGGAENHEVTPERLKQHREVFARRVYQTEHPLVLVHHVTGKRALLVGHFIRKLVGYGAADSARILDLLHSHVTSPENTIRWRWSVGDLAIWDNRATVHRAVDDYGAQPRILHRTTVAGEPPVSMDGRRSVARLADADPVLAAA